MRSVRFNHFGEPADVLAVEELSRPAPGAGQVLIRMAARPINPSDLFMIRGVYGILPRLPATPGFEGAGSVVEVGTGVTDLQTGQLVVPTAASGTWQEYLVADRQTVIPLPAGIDEQQGAMLLVNPPTAWLLLHAILGVQRDEWVIQTAGNSAVGQYVIELAKRAGIRTISVVRRRDAVAPLLARGADAVICTADEDLADRVRTIAGKGGVRYGIDAVGGEIGAAVAHALARGGKFVVYGRQAGQPLALDPADFIFKQLTVMGFWLAAWFRDAADEDQARLWSELLPLVHSGELRAEIEACYDLADIKAAVGHAEREGRQGKVLLLG